ncbi:hypothetical protein ACLKA7_007801 [Drosophila subpalustris]
MVDTGESKSPGVGVRWVHQRRKEELVAITLEFGLSSEGLLEDLRRRLCAFIQAGNHSSETRARLAALEAQRPKMLELPAEAGGMSLGGQSRHRSEPDLGNAQIRDALQARASAVGKPEAASAPAIRLDQGIRTGETGVEVFRGFENPHDKLIAGSSVEARPPRGVAEQVRKWGMKYDGQADPLQFLELLEERACCMPRAVSEIFVDRAARWFLTSGLRDVTWAEFKSGFLEFFLLSQYFERLEDQIRSRRQREGEGFKDYLIDIRALMHYSGYSDTQVLRRVYENAAPEYKLYNPSLAPGGRPLNPFRASPEAARAPAVGVPALPAPGDAANQMMTQSAGSGLNSRRACHRQCGQRGRNTQNCCGSRCAGNDQWRSLGQGQGDANTPATRQ